MTMKLVIIAGGKGTRMGSAAAEMPKPMLRVGDKPVLEHQIGCARENGITDIIILTGHLSEIIETHFSSNSFEGMNIACRREPFPMGTAGCLRLLEADLNEDFLVIYGDVMADLHMEPMIRRHRDSGACATLMVHPNDHPFDSDLLDIDGEGRITGLYPKPRPERGYYRNLVNAGFYVLSPDILKYIADNGAQDFGRDVFPRLFRDRAGLYGYLSSQYIKDMGTPERLREVTYDLLSGRIRRLNAKNRQAAVFLDRDGVLNREVNFLSRPEELELLPGVDKAIRKINKSGILAIVASNQPVVARGECSLEGLREIHNKLESLLGNAGAYLDRIYFCPHHPDRGFEGEMPEYKIACDCRKPQPGMLLQAMNDCNIDPAKSFMVGDSTADIQAGKSAGVRAILLKTGYGGADGRFQARPDAICSDLEEAVDIIISGRKP